MGTEVISLGPGIISEMFNQRVEEEDFDQCTSINGSDKYLYVRLSVSIQDTGQVRILQVITISTINSFTLGECLPRLVVCLSVCLSEMMGQSHSHAVPC